MFSWLKRHFIPHENNNHRPHLLYGKNIRRVVIIVLLLELIVFLLPVLSRLNVTGGMAAVLPAILDAFTNQQRQVQNLPVLTVNPLLTKAAELKAEDMATKGYFAHTGPDGKTPWYWFEQVGYSYQYAGENLAVNFSDSEDVAKAWMNSPTHRTNIVKDKYTEVGTGVAKGMYKGKETIFVAQVYASPRQLAVSEKPDLRKIKIPEEKAEDNIIKKIVSNTDNNILGIEVATNLKTTEDVVDTTIKADFKNNNISAQVDHSLNFTFWQKMLSSPRGNVDLPLFIIFGMITVALILNIFIKIKHHHPDLVANGFIALCVIGFILVLNYGLTHRNMIVADNFVFPAQDSIR